MLGLLMIPVGYLVGRTSVWALERGDRLQFVLLWMAFMAVDLLILFRALSHIFGLIWR